MNALYANGLSVLKKNKACLKDHRRNACLKEVVSNELIISDKRFHVKPRIDDAVIFDNMLF